MATFVTVERLIQRLTRLSGQVPGTSVQVYSDDIFTDMINSAVSMVARKYWWPHLMDTITTQTDGSTGVVTADLSKVLDFTDIKSIFVGSSCRQLPLYSDLSNASVAASGCAIGFQPLPYTSDQYKNKIIRIVPADTQDTVTLRVRYVPGDLVLKDVIPFDQDLILYAVLWAYFIDEGDNAAQADKYMGLFNTKYTDLISAFAQHGTPTGEAPYGSDQWLTGNAQYTGPDNITGEF